MTDLERELLAALEILVEGMEFLQRKGNAAPKLKMVDNARKAIAKAYETQHA